VSNPVTIRSRPRDRRTPWSARRCSRYRSARRVLRGQRTEHSGRHRRVDRRHRARLNVGTPRAAWSCRQKDLRQRRGWADGAARGTTTINYYGTQVPASLFTGPPHRRVRPNRHGQPGPAAPWTIKVGLHPTRRCTRRRPVFVTTPTANTVRHTRHAEQGRQTRDAAVAGGVGGYEAKRGALTRRRPTIVSLGGANAVAVYKVHEPAGPVSYVGLIPTGLLPTGSQLRQRHY